MGHRISSFATASLIGLALAAAPAAQAAVLITIEEDSAGVVLSGSGTINLGALTKLDFEVGVSSITPGDSQIVSGGPVDFYGVVTSGGQFGGSGSPFFATSTSGSAFGISDLPFIGVPTGYASGDNISFSMTFGGETLSALTLKKGTYVWSWGSGANADSVTVQIGEPGATIPEPASALLFGAGLLGLSGLRRRPA